MGNRLTVRLTDEDQEVVEALAARLKISPSAVLRAGLAGLAGHVDGRRVEPPAPPSGSEQALVRAEMQVRRIGFNVNQVVRKVHAAYADPKEAEIISELLLDLVKTLQDDVEEAAAS